MDNEINEQLEAGLNDTNTVVRELANELALWAFTGADAYGYARLEDTYYCKVAEPEARMYERSEDGTWRGL